MIEAVDLSKRYEDGVLALDRLSLKVERGEIYCLLGANGAGKTTAINVFMNFIEPTGGVARIRGIDVCEDPLEARRHVAYLSENVTLYGNFTARQNLEFFARLGGCDRLERERSYAIMEQVGLPQRAFEQRVKSFSKGMRQKLGIAIVMVKEAPALFLDEPMSGLDPKAAAELVQTLKKLRDAGHAILMSTHDIFRAKELADLAGIMKEGRKVVESSRRELEHQDLEELYLEYMRGDSETPGLRLVSSSEPPAGDPPTRAFAGRG